MKFGYRLRISLQQLALALGLAGYTVTSAVGQSIVAAELVRPGETPVDLLAEMAPVTTKGQVVLRVEFQLPIKYQSPSGKFQAPIGLAATFAVDADGGGLSSFPPSQTEWFGPKGLLGPLGPSGMVASLITDPVTGSCEATIRLPLGRVTQLDVAPVLPMGGGVIHISLFDQADGALSPNGEPVVEIARFTCPTLVASTPFFIDLMSTIAGPGQRVLARIVCLEDVGFPVTLTLEPENANAVYGFPTGPIVFNAIGDAHWIAFAAGLDGGTRLSLVDSSGDSLARSGLFTVGDENSTPPPPAWEASLFTDEDGESILGIPIRNPPFYRNDVSILTALNQVGLPSPFDAPAGELEALLEPDPTNALVADFARIIKVCIPHQVSTGFVSVQCFECMTASAALAFANSGPCAANQNFVTPGYCYKQAVYDVTSDPPRCRKKTVSVEASDYAFSHVTQAPCPDIEVGWLFWSETFPASRPCCVYIRTGESATINVQSCEAY